MHKEVLTPKQQKLLPAVKIFAKNFYLAGGTAIALHLGHRHSIDFDLFTDKKFGNLKIKNQLASLIKIDKTLINDLDEYTVVAAGVKFTFLYYPFGVKAKEKFETIITLPDLLTLAAMKAYTLSRRAKWKDYVDLYFIIKDHYPIKKITARAQDIFGKEFNEKNFRASLSYFKDVNHSEQVEFLKGMIVADKKIKEYLIQVSLSL
ncbi:MAG TPA: nucleotidyl transferase AbiEii/AbiGii toxin family protein [bacterium]|nr:nucleotidyl transferase AbiEii/AbiGii toxin family protein [bacterium]